MSELVDAVRSLGVPFETSDSGNWVRFICEEGVPRYVVRDRCADGYLTWCQTDESARPEWYLWPAEAIHRHHRYPLPVPPARDAAPSRAKATLAAGSKSSDQVQRRARGPVRLGLS